MACCSFVPASSHTYLILSQCVAVQEGQQHLQEDSLQHAHATQLQELQAAHEQQLRRVQAAAQQSQADLQTAHAVQSKLMQEAHAADMQHLQEVQETSSQALAQGSSEARHPQDLSTSEIGIHSTEHCGLVIAQVVIVLVPCEAQNAS